MNEHTQNSGGHKSIDIIIKENAKNFHHKDIDSLFAKQDQALGRSEITQLTGQVEELKRLVTPQKKSRWIEGIKWFFVSFIFIKLISLSFFENKTQTPIVLADKKTDIIGVKPLAQLTEMVTLKYVNLRGAPDSRGRIISVLPPNSSVQMLEQKGGWMQVLFTDHVKSKQLKGWAFYENLKRVNSLNTQIK